MHNKYLRSLLLRVIFPGILLITIAIRPFGMSLVYLLLFFLTPPLPLLNGGNNNRLLKFTAILSPCLFFVHLVWHIVLAIFPPYASILDTYPLIRLVGNNLGLVSFKHLTIVKAALWLSPEVFITISSMTLYLILRRKGTDESIPKKSKHQTHRLLTNAGKYVSMFFVMFSGIIIPSVTSGIYFLVFLILGTWWALDKSFGKGFAVIGRCLMPIMALHTLFLLVYQCTWILELVPPDMNYARYFGLTKIVEINTDMFWYQPTSMVRWETYTSPLVILLTYYILGLETTELFKPKGKRNMIGLEGGQENGSKITRRVSLRRTKDRWASVTKQVAIPYISIKVLRGSPSETTPLMRSPSALKSKWPSIKSSRIEFGQGSTGTIVIDQGSEAQSKPTLGYEIGVAVIDFCQILVRSSYIAATIIMMAWSILYHSWLTFVLLMWANIVWLTHNQRKTMLKSSPVLVFYAMVLVIIQYIYGMNLTEDELPSDSKIEGINFKQIGISRSVGSPCIPLLVKTLFTCMFWITLRQSKQESKAQEQEAVLSDWAAPVTVSAAPSETHGGSQSRLFIKLGIYLRWMCARCWIYVVAIMLFVIGITGDRMTIFRIIYMFLFLVFILLFQISWTLWRRLMYMFWVVVIMYSMINLILIYVYQFDKFSNLIETYLSINKKLQYDLGLATYDPADLFVKLLTPTCFLIITIIQVHYFHKDFMALSDPEVHHERESIFGTRKFSQGASTMKDDIPPLPLEGEKADSLTEPYSMASGHGQRRSVGTVSSKQEQMETNTRPSISFQSWLQLKFIKWKHHFLRSVDLFILYLEIHLMKVIFVSLMLLCTFEVCALHVPIMTVICPALWMNHNNQRRMVLVISTLLTVFFMMKMVYQIEYINHSGFNTNCSLGNSNEDAKVVVFNNAKWFGFIKANINDKRLVSILKGYIGLIAIFTLHSLVSFRQASHRKKYNLPESKDKLMFPRIRREDADKNLLSCFKYLTNYGFYKFGVEISLICMMGVIGSRMDLYAVIYAIWLMVLVTMDRRQQARVWHIFTGFLTIIIPIQYLFAVGILPYFCVKYPWSGSTTQMKHIRSFVYLPYNAEPPYATKLIFDYFLLLFTSLQYKVFRRESIFGETYPGGSNSENIGQHWETPNFVNPVPDFTGFVGTWLDVVKRMVFLGMLWVTLAIMFMTGTNRVNLFSMGYLIGSFIFLWQGTDYYLLPKNVILLWWSWLLRYNVSVVVIKALLQIAGCIFGEVLQFHSCWLVQLLGIGCVDKFAGGSISKFIKMEYKKTDVCSVPQEDIGLAWDGVCFAFLILQKRLFHSYYFYRVIDESKATTVLASRGAELIEHLRQKQMRMQEEQEIAILKKIKIKMEKIKANQKKIQGISKEPADHDIECDEDGESEQVPLVRGDSDASGRGYHTPDSPASPRGFHTPLSESSAPPSPRATPPPTPLPEDPLPAPLPSITAPLSSHGGPPSPSSALLTSLSLDAYLEPRRISFESPPSSDLLPRAQSPEESYPVFSPPPIRRRHTVASPSVHQRTSVISQSSRSEPKSHHTSRRSDCPPYRPPNSHQQALRSGDYYMFEDLEDTELPEEEQEVPDEDAKAVQGMGLGTLVSTIIKTDMKHALNMQRRASMPAVAVRRRSSVLLSLVSQAPGKIFELRARTSFRSAPVSERDVQPHFTDQQPPGGRGPPGEGPPEKGPPGELPFSAPASITDVEPSRTWFDKLRQFGDIVMAFVSSFLISTTRVLMRYSRDYRYVSRTLTIEKKILKEREGFGIGIREGAQQRWEPLPEALGTHRKLSDISVPEIRILAPSMERGLDLSPAPSRRASPPPPLTPSPSTTPEAEGDADDTSEHESVFSLQSTESKEVSLLAEQDDSMFKRDRWPVVHVIYALWYAILAHTDIVCYIMVFINQIQSATILSIPLPLMVFLWGTLTIPRPTKTFWVTLIAYTEVIVLIKSMFQFEILPWNQKVVPANMPFTAPRIIGIERKSNYAVYDLLLLLIIFLHRFMLKSLGLWKESSPEVELREDMEFRLTPEDTSNLVDGNTEEVGRKYVKIHNETGPSHRLVDRLRHVERAIEGVMRELNTTRSDPRVLHRVNQRLQRIRAAARRKHHAHTANKTHLDEYDHQQETPESPQNVSHEEGGEANGAGGGGSADRPDGAGPSKPTDDEYYNVNDDQEPIIAVTTTLEDPYAHCPGVLLLSIKRYLLPPQLFFKRMLEPMARVTADIYAYMFLCDFTNFLVVIFGFAAFGTHQGDGGVQAYLEENKVPIPFLVMLILQFALIVIDRALYLRKFMLGKILFQYGLIIGVHVWMFFVLPFITERTFNTDIPPPLWYMVKCVYLLLSAYQIRCGYPRRIIGNFLCKSYRFFNMVAFRGFMAIPFVFELRTLMDWIWTDTSMTLMDWLKMEDVFASVYLLKCSRYIESEFPQKRGSKKSTTAKYLLGGGVLMFVIAIIWFPLVFFAFGNTVGKPNPPTDVTVKIRIGPFLPVYQMSAQSHNIYSFTEQDYSQLSNMYARDRPAQTFFSNYMYNDVAVIILNPNSTMKWSISPPELDRLEREAESNATLKVKFTFVITHPSNNAQNPPTIEEFREVELPATGPNGQRNHERDILYNMLVNKSDSDTWLTVPRLFPKFLKVFNKGTAKPVSQLTPIDLLQDMAEASQHYYHDVQMRLERDRGSMYWRVKELCTSLDSLLAIPMNNCDMLVMYTFNDKLFPATLNFISGGGIIGLYTTFVFLASRVIRGFFSGIYTKIMFDDLPNVDRVLQLCLDIYLVREALELSLEEDLFAKLVFLYRSPETMIKWSRPKDDPYLHEAERRALPPSR